MADVLPRVNFETMQRYTGRKVLLVGEVKNVDQAGAAASLRTSDDGEVRVQMNAGSGASWTETPFVEVVCHVLDARTVREDTHLNLKGAPLDMRLYNEMIKLTSNKYAELFTA